MRYANCRAYEKEKSGDSDEFRSFFVLPGLTPLSPLQQCGGGNEGY